MLSDPQRRERSATQWNERQQEYDKPVEGTVLRDRFVRSCGLNCRIHQFEPERTIAGDEMLFAALWLRLAGNAFGGIQEPSQIETGKNQSKPQTQMVQFNGNRTVRAALPPIIYKCCEHLWIDRILGRINVDVQAVILQIPEETRSGKLQGGTGGGCQMGAGSALVEEVPFRERSLPASPNVWRPLEKRKLFAFTSH